MTAPLFIPAIGADCCEAPGTLPDPAAEPLAHDGWWPGLDLTRLRLEARVRDAVTAERLRDAALAALIWVGEQLATWQAAQRASGHADLGAVPCDEVAGESRFAILYRQAATAMTKAALVERYRDVDTTAAGDRRVDELDPAIGELRRDAIHSVRAILGTTRTAVELI